MQKGDKIKVTEDMPLMRPDPENPSVMEPIGSLKKGTEGTFEGTKGIWSMIRVDIPKFRGLLIPILVEKIELVG